MGSEPKKWNFQHCQEELIANNLLPHLFEAGHILWVRSDQTNLKSACFCLKIVDSPPVGELHSPVTVKMRSQIVTSQQDGVDN